MISPAQYNTGFPVDLPTTPIQSGTGPKPQLLENGRRTPPPGPPAVRGRSAALGPVPWPVLNAMFLFVLGFGADPKGRHKHSNHQN